MLNEAEQQEWREAILGYFFLLKIAPFEGATSKEIDGQVEAFLDQHAGLQVDFEVKDALGKLKRLKLVNEHEQDRYVCVPLPIAIESLHEAWDEQFQRTIGASLSRRATASRELENEADLPRRPR